MTKVSDIVGMSVIGGRASGAGEMFLDSVGAADDIPYSVRFRVATTQEVKAAAEAAASAFSPFAHSTPQARAALLETIAGEIEALGAELIEQAHRETGLGRARLEGEKARTVAQLRMFGQLLREPGTYAVCVEQALPDRLPLARPEMRRAYTGIGPVAVFGSSNFPLAFSVAGGDTASALAAGCPVVVKAHPSHLVTSEMVAYAIVRAVRASGLPAGIFALLIGGNETSSCLVEEPSIKAVGFTGSLAGGMALHSLAAQRREPIPVFAEMSSINPIIVFAGAQQARGGEIAVQIAESIKLGNGQFCTKPGLILVMRTSVSAEFVDALQAGLRNELQAPMLNGVITSAYRAGVRARVEDDGLAWLSAHALDDVLRCEIFKADESAFRRGDTLLGRELFGPAATVVVVADVAGLVDGLQRLGGQLTATVYGEHGDFDSIVSVLPQLEKMAGRLIFNTVPTGVEVNRATVHGGPYPATTDARFTSVGTQAIERFRRAICYQNFPHEILPAHMR